MLGDGANGWICIGWLAKALLWPVIAAGLA
jgi:hypothetical protein